MDNLRAVDKCAVRRAQYVSLQSSSLDTVMVRNVDEAFWHRFTILYDSFVLSRAFERANEARRPFDQIKRSF